MRQTSVPLLVSNDPGLIQHWCNGLHLKSKAPIEMPSFEEFQRRVRRKEDIVWLDMNLPNIPAWDSSKWKELIGDRELRIIAASSNPTDGDAIAALGAGCVGYCHSYSDNFTLNQISQVTKAGHIWIGTNLMQQLIQSAGRAAAPPSGAVAPTWQSNLTAREREVAKLAANGASNLKIAQTCNISERTVKAHLSAVFDKLAISDRLQLALKVHGIQ